MQLGIGIDMIFTNYEEELLDICAAKSHMNITKTEEKVCTKTIHNFWEGIIKPKLIANTGKVDPAISHMNFYFLLAGYLGMVLDRPLLRRATQSNSLKSAL